MARPIAPTPILRGKDAEKLYREVKNTPPLTPEKRAELKRYEALYKKFYSRLKK